MLVVAQVLKHDVPVYRGMPSTDEGRREYALHQYSELVTLEFASVERELITMARRMGGQAARLALQVLQEQQEIIRAFEALEEVEKHELSERMNELGYQLASHVRFKERIFFMALQEVVQGQENLPS
jgi:hypothetical protein